MTTVRSTPTFTAENVALMTVPMAEKLGIQQYRDGKTFQAANVRPKGFLEACIRAGRRDLIEALDRGWHVANLAEPVRLPDGTYIGSSTAQQSLEEKAR